MYSTNYANTFIEVAEDSKATVGIAPPERAKKTVARMQYDMLYEHPYQFSSDDLLFTLYALRNDIGEAEWPQAREAFFSQGQPCLRSSPLAKTYGWGIHFDGQSRIALYSLGSMEYQRLLRDAELEHLRAMRNSR